MSRTPARTTKDVFEDHLRLRTSGAPLDDIAHNYAEDVIVLSGMGVHRGIDGIRETVSNLDYYLPNGSFQYRTTLVEGEMAFLEWSGVADGVEVCDGADSFVIRDGLIVAQTIHYTVNERA